MDYNTIWNEICFHVNKNRNVTEDVFQSVIESLLEKLGWSAYGGEIISQKTVGIGSASNLRPDIIIETNGKEIFVVELKRANELLSARHADQLISYMRFGRLAFGVLLGKTLQIYYDSPDTDSNPTMVCDIPFDNDLEEGVECISVLSKAGYSYNNLQQFCIACLADPEKYVKKTDMPVVSYNNTYGGGSSGWSSMTTVQ